MRKKIINFSEETQRLKKAEDSRPILVTFLGFMGHKNCMSDIAKVARFNNFRTLEASPFDTKRHSFYKDLFALIDAYAMKNYNYHIGLGSVESQTKAAYKNFFKILKQGNPLVLCGHSQGGMIAINFYNRYKNVFNIKGIITLSTPLNGVTLYSAIGSRKIIKKSIEQNGSEQNSFYKKTIFPSLMAYLLVPALKFILKIFVPAINDFAKSKKLNNKNKIKYRILKEDNIPFLNIMATCIAPVEFSDNDYLRKYNLKLLLSGGENLKNDNLLSECDQKMELQWDNLSEIEVKGDHGLFNINGYPKVFSHPKTLMKISSFLKSL